LFPILNYKWSLELEIDFIRSWDIGVMPMPDSELTKGKAGFKLLQYMGLGLVSIANDVGINADIVSDGVNGFLVTSSSSWESVLERALQSQNDWARIGQAASERIAKKYSFEANAPKFIEFLKQAN
jgi:glycosyltransferase involved in cell wall biosynthesis